MQTRKNTLLRITFGEFRTMFGEARWVFAGELAFAEPAVLENFSALYCVFSIDLYGLDDIYEDFKDFEKYDFRW